jgi:hypothetical protein
MTASSVALSRWRSTLRILSLAVAGVLFTLGFACAAPLAAFATIAAITFDRREALIATTAVWLANQTVGFAFLHYPTDGVTLAWGGALGVIALLSCETAGFTTRRIAGVVGVCAAFLVAFIAYQGSLIVIDLVIGQGGDELAFATVARIFLINACAFGGLWALKIVASTTAFGRKVTTALAPRHV